MAEAGQTNGILNGLCVVEGSAFVAAPLGGMTLAQLGADVIRFDPIGGVSIISDGPLLKMARVYFGTD